MTISPQDIQSKQFHIRFRGFDVDEVDGFLEQVAEHYLMALEEKRLLSEQVETLRQEMKSLKNEEHSFKDALIAGQKVVDEMKQRGRERADELLSKARQEVKELKDAANQEIAELEGRVDELRAMQGELAADLRRVIDNYISGIEQNIDGAPNRVRAENNEPREEDAPAPDTTPDPPLDLDDLYEKIDLNADSLPGSEMAADMGLPDELPKAPDTISLDVEGPEMTMPDLDNEVMFTLEDPLDNEEIDISIAGDKKKDE
ncbi:MAG TPA: DivIVA domain-containing protein [Desulfobacterales bacterium]|nr:DivIVA domain-containing protein [Desulfobacterales bacterium]